MEHSVNKLTITHTYPVSCVASSMNAPQARIEGVSRRLVARVPGFSTRQNLLTADALFRHA